MLRLHLTYSYTVKIYLTTDYGLINTYEGSFSVSGNTNFDNSYIP
jgi:hypothetical protein